MPVNQELEQLSAHRGSPREDSPAEESAVLSLLLLLAERKALIAKITFAITFMVALVLFLRPNIFTAQTRIMPPQQSQSTATAMMGQLGSMVALAGGGGGFSVKNPSDVFVSMLQSRTIAEKLIQRFKLQQVYDQELMTDTVKQLADATNITATKDGVILIEVDDKDPKLAAEIANAYVEELFQLTRQLAITEAARRRIFFEGQRKEAMQGLENAERELKLTQQKTGLILPESQARAVIQSIAIMQAEVSAKEVQLSSMRSFATEQNPDLIRVQQELAGLRLELQKLQRNRNAGQGDILVGTKNVPEIALEYARKFRNVKYYETMYELLSKQFEIAKIDEAKDAPLIQALDVAVPPEKKSKPKRRNLIVGAFVLSFLLGCLVVFTLHLYQRARLNPALVSQIDRLRAQAKL